MALIAYCTFLAGIVALAVTIDRVVVSLLGVHPWQLFTRKYKNPEEPR